MLCLRGGYGYDQSPVQDEHLSPTLPDANRNNLALGLGYKLGNLGMDLAYFMTLFAERTSENQEQAYLPLLNGNYKTIAHIFNLSFNYSL